MHFNYHMIVTGTYYILLTPFAPSSYCIAFSHFTNVVVWFCRNYVVQHLLLMKVPNVTANLVDELQGHFFSLACNKYGSNVVEKCLTETRHEFSDLVILELLKTPNVSKLLQDPYGNYVFQSALSVSKVRTFVS